MSRRILKVLDEVRHTTKAVVQASTHVTIRREGVEGLALSLKDRVKTQDAVEWDEEGWHFRDDAPESGPLTCQYLMVLDALNFCFWPTAGLEYEQLAKGLTKVLRADRSCFDAHRLADLTTETLASWLPEYQIPQLDERTRKVREVGGVLLEHFDGLAANVVERAGHSVDAFVRLVTSHFPGFRDEAIYKGCQVFFYKRAQILAGDIWGAYGRRRGPQPFGFDDMEQLTMFADYRVPQILRARGVLQYSPSLAESVDARRVLAAGSEEEVEIRAATVQAVEMVKTELSEVHRVEGVLSLTLDWLLWQEGEKLKEEIPPHHRTLTIFY